MTDLQAFLQYLVTIEVLGMAAFPLVRRIFKHFPDQGWVFSKIAGLLLVSWAAWLAGILKIAPFTVQTLLGATAVVAGTAFLSLLSKKLKFLKKLKGQQAKKLPIPYKLILFQELLFIAAFAGWSYLRAFAPDIHGLEKYMDYGFMLSILRAKYFPPLDHFLAGETINYYYFGHLMAAVMTRLSQVPANIAYNLQMNMLFALTVVESFVLGSTLYAKTQAARSNFQFLAAGVLAAFFVALAGNLHAIIYWSIEGAQYWYPDATRFIENTIHEFPIYSFVVNDLHGHVADLPVVLLIIGLLFVYFVRQTVPLHKIQDLRFRIQEERQLTNSLPLINLKSYFLNLLPIAFAIGSTYATNAWDFMIYLVLSGLVFLLAELLLTKTNTPNKSYAAPMKRVLPPVVLRSILLLGLAILFMLPYWLTVKPVGQGVGIVPWGGQSPPWRWLILWGHFVLFTVIFSIWVLRKLRPKFENWDLRFENFTSLFVLAMMLWSLVLILLPEIIFVRDIYPTHYRANTMFKFGYQAFVMFGISTAYVIVRFWDRLTGIKKYAFRALAVLIIFAVGLYPIRAIDSGLNGLNKDARKSLDGTAYLKTLRPSDAKAINWINENMQGQPTIAEAVGESYTDYARVAANTGIPVVMGWPVHEWLWRGSYSDPMRPTTNLQKQTGQLDTVAARVEDMKRFYETDSVTEALGLIKKYQIDYIYVGELEREKYPNLVDGKFDRLGNVVYQHDSVTIIKVDDRL